jgi:hypothetical protein
MRPNQQNKNRQRGRNNNNGGRKHINPLSRTYESNGPDVKVRGNAAHIAEKYQQLARDANASGDAVMAENYLQHAEHYFRIVSAAQPQGMPRPDQFGQDTEDFDNDFPEIPNRFAIPEPQQYQQPEPQPTEQPMVAAPEPEAEPAVATGAANEAEAPSPSEAAPSEEPRRHRERRPRRRRAPSEANGAEANGEAQGDLPGLPAFLTAGGTPAE